MAIKKDNMSFSRMKVMDSNLSKFDVLELLFRGFI